MSKRGKSNIIASMLTFAVITILIVASPAYAWQVSLQPYSNEFPIQGEIITAKFNLKLQNETNLGMDKIEFSIDGEESANCFYDIHGALLSGENGNHGGNGNGTVKVNVSKAKSIGAVNMTKIEFMPGNPGNETIPEICEHVSLKMIPLEDYGYGYGYGYGYQFFTYEGNETALKVSGNMPYLLTVDTSVLDLGEYKSKITLILNSKDGTEEHISESRPFTVITGLKKDDNQDPPSTGGRWRHNDTLNESNSEVPLASDIVTPGDQTPTTPEQTPGFFSRITGAVIGTLGKTGTAIIGIVIIALIAGTAALQVRRKFFFTGTSGASASAASTSQKAAVAAA